MKKMTGSYVVVAFYIFYIILPLVATLLYSLAGDWHNTVLPQNLGLKWYQQLIRDSRFLTSLGHSFMVCLMVMVVSLLVVTSALVVVALYLPHMDGVMESFCMLPYGIPAVSAAVGLLKAYSSLRSNLLMILILLGGAYFMLILPYMYGGIRNRLRSLNIPELVQTAELLGARPGQIFRLVVIPNLLPGLLVSSLLSLSILFGDFALANLLVGGMFETVQLYLFSSMRINGHFASALVIFYYLFILLASILILKLSQPREQNE